MAMSSEHRAMLDRRKQRAAEDYQRWLAGLPIDQRHDGPKGDAMTAFLQKKRDMYESERATRDRYMQDWIALGGDPSDPRAGTGDIRYWLNQGGTFKNFGQASGSGSSSTNILPSLPQLTDLNLTTSNTKTTNTTTPAPLPQTKPTSGGNPTATIQPSPNTSAGGNNPFGSPLPQITGSQLYQQGNFTPNSLEVGDNPYANQISGLMTQLQNIGSTNNLAYNTAANRIRERSTADTSQALNSISNRNLSRGMGNSGINDKMQVQAATSIDQNTANSLAGLEQAMAQLSLQQMGQQINAFNSAAGIGMGLGQDDLARQSLGAQGVFQNNSILADLFNSQEGRMFDANKYAVGLNEQARAGRESNLLDLFNSTNQLNTQRDIANLQSSNSLAELFIRETLGGLFS